MSLCCGTEPPPSMRISRDRDQTVPKDASTCWMYGLAASAGVGCISPVTESFCAAADGDQARGRIAFVLLRMARPGISGKRFGLRAQARGIEADRQPEEGLG